MVRPRWKSVRADIVQGSHGEQLALRVKGYGPHWAAMLHRLPYRLPGTGDSIFSLTLTYHF